MAALLASHELARILTHFGLGRNFQETQTHHDVPKWTPKCWCDSISEVCAPQQCLLRRVIVSLALCAATAKHAQTPKRLQGRSCGKL